MSDPMRDTRNESTPEARDYWRKFEEAGEHAPEWYKRVVDRRSPSSAPQSEHDPRLVADVRRTIAERRAAERLCAEALATLEHLWECWMDDRTPDTERWNDTMKALRAGTLAHRNHPTDSAVPNEETP